MMNTTELNALKELVKYIMENEHTSYEEHLDTFGGEKEGHIYNYAQTLDDYIKGLHSTGNIQNANI